MLNHQGNDGDRFHVKVNGKEKNFRLYFVDCPETPSPFWERVNVILLNHQGNDGDRFHVKVNGKEKNFRLYFVDCPETPSPFWERVKEKWGEAKNVKAHRDILNKILRMATDK